MIRILFIIIYLMAFLPLFCQEPNCENYIQRIDSLIQQGDYLYFDDQRLMIQPAENCESALLGFTENKGYYGNSTIYQNQINNILRYLSGSAVNKNIREKSINALLDRSYAFDVNSSFRWNKEDFDAQAKLHLIRLLKREYLPLEIERYVKESNKYKYVYQPSDSVAEYIAVENNLDFQHVKDSILKADYEKLEKDLLEKKYENLLPVFISWLDMKECIPLLDSMYRVDKNMALAMALARLGVKEYRQYFENAKVVYRDVAFYIGTQEMIYKYGKEVLSDKQKQYLWSDSPEAGPVLIAYNVIIDFQNYIEGFPRLINRNIYVDIPKYAKAVNPEVLQQANKWIEENRGHYKLKEFYPRFTPEMFKGY